MKFEKISASLAAVVVAFGIGGAVETAEAAACSPGALDRVFQTAATPTIALACDAGTQNNDSVAQVNADKLFGIETWQFAGKLDFPTSVTPGAVDVGFAILGGALGGTWSFDAAKLSKFTDAMIVLKGGAGNNTQGNFVGYKLVDLLTPNGTFATPFFNARNGNPADISHISAYVAGEATPIPLPAAAWLLLSGLGGLGVMARRKRAAA